MFLVCLQSLEEPEVRDASIDIWLCPSLAYTAKP